MAFHESFWIATSAAAPVIALAAVVALPDTAAVAQMGARRLREPIEGSRYDFILRVGAWHTWLSRMQDRLMTQCR